MAQVGNWGKQIRFSVNSESQLTFKSFKRTVTGRWAKHSILKGKPRLEFQGADASGITMDVTVSAARGVKPESVIKALERACEGGTVEYLYVGGKRVGSGKMYLESVSESWDEIWNKGELVRATLSLTFSEYT